MLGKVCLLFMHGSGSSGNEIRTYLESVSIPKLGFKTFRQAADSFDIEIVTPTADLRPYTAMGGELMNVWFDRSPSFISNGLNEVEDTTGADRSISKIMSKLEQIHMNYDHIFIGGFSMGGGLAMHALRKDCPPNVRGLFVLGGFLVQNSAVITGTLGNTAQVPLLMMHGTEKLYLSFLFGPIC
jgi:predicted esterase